MLYLAPGTMKLVKIWVDRGGITEGRLLRSVRKDSTVGEKLHPSQVPRIYKTEALGIASPWGRSGPDADPGGRAGAAGAPDFTGLRSNGVAPGGMTYQHMFARDNSSYREQSGPKIF